MLGDGDNADELVVHRDDGVPALARVFECVAGYHCLVEFRGVLRR